MADRYFNVWIEVEVIDGCDMFYEDRGGGVGYGKAGRFGTLAEAQTFADRLSVMSGALGSEVV